MANIVKAHNAEKQYYVFILGSSRSYVLCSPSRRSIDNVQEALDSGAMYSSFMIDSCVNRTDEYIISSDAKFPRELIPGDLIIVDNFYRRIESKGFDLEGNIVYTLDYVRITGNTESKTAAEQLLSEIHKAMENKSQRIIDSIVAESVKEEPEPNPKEEPSKKPSWVKRMNDWIHSEED